jgi:hypothetical protein
VDLIRSGGVEDRGITGPVSSRNMDGNAIEVFLPLAIVRPSSGMFHIASLPAPRCSTRA